MMRRCWPTWRRPFKLCNFDEGTTAEELHDELASLRVDVIQVARPTEARALLCGLRDIAAHTRVILGDGDQPSVKALAAYTLSLPAANCSPSTYAGGAFVGIANGHRPSFLGAPSLSLSLVINHILPL